MKNRSLRIIFLLFLAGFLNTCQKDVTEDEKLPPPIDKQKERAAAQQWYESHFGGLTLKSAVVEDSGRLLYKPEWKTAEVHHNRRLKTVETVIVPEDVGLTYAMPENVQKYEETGDDRYLMTLTRLVLQTHRRTGKQTGFLMTIMPSVKYLEQTEFNPFRRMAYIGRNKKFDGAIRFHHMDGTFSNGWVYADGKITHSIRSSDAPDEPRISLKGWVEVCTTYYITEFYQRCQYNEEVLPDGTIKIFNIRCGNWNPVGGYTETICEYEYDFDDEYGNNDDEFGDGDEHSGGGGGGGTYEPPSKMFHLSLTANPPEGGSVAGNGKIPEGTGRVIIAIPKPGYVFVNWTGSATVSTSTYLVQNIRENKAFTANFRAINTNCSGTAAQRTAYINSVLNDMNSNYQTVKPYVDQLRIYAQTNPNEHGFAIQEAGGDRYVYNYGDRANPAYWQTGTPNSVTVFTTKYSIFIAHSHPPGQNPAPSPADAASVVDNYKDYPDFKANLVFAHDGSEYAVCVNDKIALSAFCRSGNYADFINCINGRFKPGTIFEQQYTAVYNELKKTCPDSDAQLYALSYVLDINYTGLKVFEKKNGESNFKEIRTERSNNNYSTITCP